MADNLNVDLEPEFEDPTVVKGGWLDRLEKVGNALPDPATLFLIGAIFVMILSQVAMMGGWSVQPVAPKMGADGKLTLEAAGEQIKAVGLLTADGVYWVFANLVKNFINFPPLGIVLVGMLGIGVAEKVGMMGALLKAFLYIVPARFLTPAMVFLGVMSSLAVDAGYIVLPPLAMALYRAVGRSPIVGLAASFAGVAAGFNANLFITGLDPMLASFSTIGAQVIDKNYQVAPTANWWFMIASTFLVTLAGWFITNKFVEPRFEGKPEEEGGPPKVAQSIAEVRLLSPEEKTGLRRAGLAFVVLFAAILAGILTPGGVFAGKGENFDRWVESIVPIILTLFMVPSLFYGFAVGALKGEKDVAKTMTEAMSGMAPIIVLAFFASQFIALFNHSNLGKMLAMWGGVNLAQSNLSPILLVVAFIIVTIVFDIFIGSMSAKYAMFAPIFVPMLMLVGISPELTQAAYRIGDSVTNIITPLNAYLIIILVAMRKYVPKAGMGTLVATMVPYWIGLSILWTAMIVIWMQTGAPLGPNGPLYYEGLKGN